MFKSKIFLKIMFIVTSMIIFYTLAISIFTVPKVENDIKNLEIKNAKDTLKKVVIIINNVHNDLENFEKTLLQKHKDELTNLTDSTWSIIQTKYNQSKQENIGVILKNRADSFKTDLMNFYNKNKTKMSEDKIKKAIINYVNIHRYDNGTGYFWINDRKSIMIEHPISPQLNNKNLETLNSDTAVVFSQIKETIDNKNEGIIKYKWLNPKSKKIEEKISYVFRFEPFDWVIGTGEYYSVLKTKLQNEVFDLVNKITYDKNNYFFIANYNNILLSHPYLKGVDFSNVKDKKENLIIPPMVKMAKEKGSGFHSYWWKENKEDIKAFKKLSYVKNFPDWEMIIGTGINIDNIENKISQRKEELIEQLRSVINSTKLGKTGYLYVFNKDGKMLIHPNENLDGNEDFHKLIFPHTGINVYDALVGASSKESRSFSYKWDKPEDKSNYIYEKISWVEYIPELEWYIGSSIYTKEFKDTANNIRDFVLSIAFIILILAIIYSSYFIKNLLTPLNKLSKLVLTVSKGDYTKRYPIEKRDDEISILAHKFNEMVETIELRTNELEESNDELECMIDNLKKTQNKLIETEKLASLGSLVAGVAHEINTPVGVGLTASSHFITSSETLENKFKNDEMTEEEFKKYLVESNELASIIFSNLTRTSNIIKNFKQVAIDRTSEQKREFNLIEYSNSVLLSIDNIIKKKNVSVEIIGDNKLTINSYPGLYSQILTNLIINSTKHAFKQRDNGTIKINIELVENILEITFKDNGVGIPKEELPKIFDPFFTTNREDGGSGLGLSIVNNIITNNLKGTISCNSKINEGVTFIIKLPIED